MHDTADPARRRITRHGPGLLVVLAMVAAASVSTGAQAGAAPGSLAGAVESGGSVLAGYEVTLYRTVVDEAPEVLGTATTDAAGAFDLAYDLTVDPQRVTYVVARSADLLPARDAVTMAAVIGPDPGSLVTVNPRTTVATAYAMAQFLDSGLISGPSPGVANAASMSRNVADPTTGAIGSVIDSSPNAGETEARATFNSLANVVAACVDSAVACDALRAAGTPSGGAAPADSLQALANVVVEPGRNVVDLFVLSGAGPTPYTPARSVPPAAWTLALRFDGGGDTLSGPGNFAMDHEGTMFVATNYTYAAPGDQACGSDLLVRFAPDGSYVDGSPYAGGGLSGAGYGIARDRFGDIWVSNFGFASVTCTEQPPHTTLSQFTGQGVAVAPPEGFAAAGIDWPQGMEFDGGGNLWVANCQGNSVTYVPDGDVTRSRAITDIGVAKPFDVAFGSDGNTYVTGTESDNVAVLRPDGTPIAGSPFGGYNRPMGITSDSRGALWISNSGLIDLPCPSKDVSAVPPPSIGYIDPSDGSTATFSGGGLVIPWGISVDGDDNVWVSNFGGERLSAFCGRDGSDACPQGVGKGDPLSPEVTGYFFDGLTRATATAVDTAGNVWVTNNWKQIPQEINPGGYQVVVFLGMAGPVQAPAPDPKPGPPGPPAPTVPPSPPTTPIGPAAAAAPAAAPARPITFVG